MLSVRHYEVASVLGIVSSYSLTFITLFVDKLLTHNSLYLHVISVREQSVLH